MAIMVFGSTFPRYLMYFGVSLLSGNSKKGVARSKNVTKAINPKIIIDLDMVKGILITPF